MGIEIPSTYVTVAPSAAEMNVASIVWGVSIAFFLFSAAKGVRQSWGIWKRTRTITAYVALIWMEWVVCVAMSPVLWFYIWGTIKPSFGLFFSILCLWTFQMQCIIQIIINRIALLVRDQARIRTLQWSAAVVIGLINISVFCIWIPAQMQISPTWINVNFYWDRVEKAIFAIIDCGLNIYFVRLIRSKLISNGLTKYYPLFYFNCVMIAISVCLDGILILSMELAFVYTMFHPTVYIIKLYIEMNMADLITKTVQSSNKKNNGGASGSGANVYGLSSSTKKEKAMANKGAKSYWPGSGGNRSDGKHTAVQMQTLVTADGHKAEERDLEHGGIRRKVETQVVHEPRDDDAQSRTSSTEQLQKKFGIM